MVQDDSGVLRQSNYNATVVGLREIHSDLRTLRIRPDYPIPPHKPGQYSTLGMGHWEPRAPGCQEESPKPGEHIKLIRRAYSISCPVLDDAGQLLALDKIDWLEFYIVLVRSAEKRPPALTPRLFLLKEGDRIFLGEKITGHFNLDPVQPGDTVLFLSTGTGEAPHNYMTWELLRRGHTGKILAACCVRYRRDLGYYDLHQTLMRRYKNYLYLPLTTREADTVHHKVYIQDLLTSGQMEEKLGAPLDPARTHVFLCGNPSMIGVPAPERTTGQLVYPKPPGVIEILEARGFHADQHAKKILGNIHFEEYW